MSDTYGGETSPEDNQTRHSKEVEQGIRQIVKLCNQPIISRSKERDREVERAVRGIIDAAIAEGIAQSAPKLVHGEIEEILERLSQAQWKLGNDGLIPLSKNVWEAEKAITVHLQAAVREAEIRGHIEEWLALDKVVGFTKKRNKAVYRLQLPLEYVQRRTKELKIDLQQLNQGEEQTT